MDSANIMDTSNVNLPSRQISESKGNSHAKRLDEEKTKNFPLEDSVSDSLKSARELIDKIKKDIPENRPEMIELGKSLLQDETYPSAQNLRTVANQLLKDLGRSDTE